MKRTILLVVLMCALSAGQMLAEDPAKTAEERQAKARKVVMTVNYENLVTQHAKTDDAPVP